MILLAYLPRVFWGRTKQEGEGFGLHGIWMRHETMADYHNVSIWLMRIQCLKTTVLVVSRRIITHPLEFFNYSCGFYLDKHLKCRHTVDSIPTMPLLCTHTLVGFFCAYIGLGASS